MPNDPGRAGNPRHGDDAVTPIDAARHGGGAPADRPERDAGGVVGGVVVPITAAGSARRPGTTYVLRGDDLLPQRRAQPPEPTREQPPVLAPERVSARPVPAWKERLAESRRSAAVLRRYSLRGVMARKVRLALTALAVVLGVCFVSGTYVLTDTLQRSFDRVFAQTAVGVDVVVRTQAPFGADATTTRVRLPAGVLTAVRQSAGVARAEGIVEGYAQFVERYGRTAISNAGAPTIGISWDSRDHVSPLRVDAGRPPVRDGEVAMDSATAHRYGFHVGDDVRVLLTGPARTFRLVGTMCFASQCDLGGATFAAFDTTTAQRVFDAPGAFDMIDVKAAPGTSRASLERSLRQALPGYDVTSADVVAKQTGQQVHDAFGFLNDALLGFASLGVFVGAFIIFNTFTILVSQRTRELGLLRALGARSGQVMRSVVAEAAAVGAFASAVGLVLGVALAVVLLRLLDDVGLHVPGGQTVVLGRTVVAAVVVGMVVTVGSAIHPALRASRISPVSAINDLGPQRSAPLRRRAITGTVVVLAGLAVLAYGLVRSSSQLVSRMEVVGIGALGTFVGIALLSPVLARPLSRMLGWPLLRTHGVTGALARGNAMRNPRRTAATASALTIGLALVCLVAIFAASAKTSLHDALDTGVRADYILSAQQFAGFSPIAADRVAGLPAVRDAVSLRFNDAQVGNNGETVTGIDPVDLDLVVNLGMKAGQLRLGPGDVLLHETEASGYHVPVGGMLTISFPRTGPIPLRVAGIFTNDHFTGGVPVKFLVSQATFESGFGGSQQNTLTYVKAKPGRVVEAKHQIERVLRDFPNVSVQTPAGFQRQQEQTIDMFLSVLVALLLLSEVIAILGIVNTLALSVFERTRELGLLRAVGMSRRQVRRMVRGESVIIAVMGGLLGIGVGVFWGWAMTHSLRDQGVTHFSVPPVELVVFLVASAIAGIVAAVVPAWRAGHLDVLEAVATE